jgi:hypothetical protein
MAKAVGVGGRGLSLLIIEDLGMGLVKDFGGRTSFN